MSKTAQITVRLDPETKQEAEDVLQALGLNASQAIHLFLRQVVLRRALPFAVALPMDETPNPLTYQTILDTLAGKDLRRVSSVKALFDELDA